MNFDYTESEKAFFNRLREAVQPISQNATSAADNPEDVSDRIFDALPVLAQSGYFRRSAVLIIHS